MNRNQSRRDEIMKFEEPEYIGGLQNFEELTAQQLETLVAEEFISAKDSFKGSPDVASMLNFMKQNEEVWAHGYVVSESREDYRVNIRGLYFLGKPSKELAEAFGSFCATASDMRIEKDELFAEWE